MGKAKIVDSNVRFSFFNKETGEWADIPNGLLHSVSFDADFPPCDFELPEIQSFTMHGDGFGRELSIREFLWCYEVSSSWLPLNRYTNRYFYWKVDRKLKSINIQFI